MKRSILLTLLLFAGLSWAAAQTRVTGKVTNRDTGEPVPFATVAIKGTTVGVNTDDKGNYSINVPSSDAVLLFSFVGYATVEQVAGSRSVVDVTLQSESTSLSEVVVTAMGITREKKSIGYATQEVKAEKLTQVRQTDLNNAIVGKVSGVRFWGASGATFDAGTIILRGTSSLTDSRGGAPIYVVDGVITNVNSVNMDDVESVNVLKGPAATAIYGSRGGNGAVIVTSKKGVQGKGHFEFNQTFAMETVATNAEYQNEYGGGNLGAEGELLKFEYNPSVHPSYLQAMDGKRYYDMENDFSWGPKFDGQPYAPWYAWDPTDPRFGQTAPWSGQSSDNLKDLYKTGFASTTNVAFSRSTDKFSTRISFTNVQRSGVMENSYAVRRFFSINANYNVNERLSISADYKYTYRKNHNAAAEGYGGLQNATYSYAQWFHRNVNLKDLKDGYRRTDGTFRSWNPSSLTDLTPAFHDNPFMLMNEIDRIGIDQWSTVNGTVKYEILKNKLTLGGTVLANVRNHLGETKVPYNIAGETSRFATDQNSLWDTQLQGFLSFNDRYFDHKLSVSARLFVEQRDYDYKSISSSTAGGLTSNYYYNLAASVEKATTSNSVTLQKDRAVFGNGVVGWDDTYYVDFSLRNDWSSTLPEHLNSYLYGGLSLSAIASNYLKNVSWLDFWKVRASLAQVGSTMSPYNVLEPYVLGTKYGNQTTMRTDLNMKDPNIRPTISTSYEFGTEWRMFNNRFYGDINYYIKDSKDQIINLSVAPASGYTSAKINAGLIRNKGYEITLGGSPVKTRDAEWEVYFNWSQNKNTLVELDADDPSTTQYRLTWYAIYTYAYMFAEVGKPIGVIRGSTYKKSPDGQIIYTPRSNGYATGEASPTLLSTAQEELGNVQPDATGGFGTSFSWKGLRLSLAFDYQIGGQVLSANNMFGEQSGLLKSTAGKNDRGGDLRADVWKNNGGVKVTGVTQQGPDDNATYTPFTGYMDAQYYFDYKGRLWEPYTYDASYLKLRELSLTYSLPNDLVKKLNIGLSQARVSFVAQNPWLIYSGVPNEDASEIGNSYYNYMSGGQMFRTRTWGFSLNLTF